MNSRDGDERYTLVTVTVSRGETVRLCDLATAAEASGLHPELIHDICQAGYVEARVVEGEEEKGLYFDERAMHVLGTIRSLREDKGVNMRGVRIILKLMGRLESLEREMKYLRDRLM